MKVMSSIQGRGAVQTQAELQTLLRSRDVLSDQLERVTEQRGRLAQERLNAEARANSSSNPTLDRRLMQEYEQQISELGTRGGELQRQIAQADEAIANAVARGVGSAETQGEGGNATVISVPGEDFSAREALLVKRYESLMIAQALGLILGSILVGRFLWRRATRLPSKSSAFPKTSATRRNCCRNVQSRYRASSPRSVVRWSNVDKNDKHTVGPWRTACPVACITFRARLL